MPRLPNRIETISKYNSRMYSTRNIEIVLVINKMVSKSMFKEVHSHKAPSFLLLSILYPSLIYQPNRLNVPESRLIIRPVS